MEGRGLLRTVKERDVKSGRDIKDDMISKKLDVSVTDLNIPKKIRNSVIKEKHPYGINVE